MPSSPARKNTKENVVQRYGMEDYNLAYTPEVGPKLSLNQPENKLMNEEKRHYQVITGAAL